MDQMVAAIVFSIIVIVYLALLAPTLFLHITGRLNKGKERTVEDDRS